MYRLNVGVYDGCEYGCDSGHFGHADLEDAESAATAWVWDFAEGGADFGWGFQGEPGVVVDGSAAAGAGGVAGLRVAADGELSAGEVLHVDGDRKGTA